MSKTNQYQRFLAATAEKPVEVKTKKTAVTPAPVLPVITEPEPKKVEEIFVASIEEKVEEKVNEIVVDEKPATIETETKKKR